MEELQLQVTADPAPCSPSGPAVCLLAFWRGCYWQLGAMYNQTLQKLSTLSLPGDVAPPLMVQEQGDHEVQEWLCRLAP